MYFSRAMQLFDRLEDAPLEERMRWTEERLRIILKTAATTSRYGRSFGSERLADWPLLEKESVRDDPEAFLGRGRHFAAHASTSGTTGTPLKLIRSPRAVVVEQAAVDRLTRAKGVDLATARLAVLRGDDVSEPGSAGPMWRDDLGGRRRAFASNRLSAETIDTFADALRTFTPDCLLAYPTVLESLCRLLDRQGLELGVPLTLTSSEALSAGSRRLAEEILHTEIVDYYGQAERVSFAYSMAAGAFTFLPGYGVTELLRAGGDEETDVFEIVGTSLWNVAMPLIRYRTGDLVALPKGASADLTQDVCFGVRSVPRIEGRANDFLISPIGERLVGIDHIPRDVDNVLRLQVIQEAPDFVRVLIVAKAGFGEADRAQITTNLRRKIPGTMHYALEVVDALERAASGKTPLVIRRFQAGELND
jgi:phenylacetate-CoA ligase